MSAAVTALPAPDADRTAARAAPPMPGYRAMWIGVSLEYVEFAVFFAVYFTARWFNPEAFAAGAARLWTTGGVLVTLTMLTAGLLLTRAVDRMRRGRPADARGWLVAALLVGLCYPALKIAEWRWNLAHGLDARAGVFVVVYYYLTINHFIHACWGLLGMAWGVFRLSSRRYAADDAHGVEAIATYWHATDLVWLMIFALFYAFA